MLVGVDVNAVALVLWIEGSLGCVLIASWYGENPWMLVNEFWRLLTKGQLILGHNYFLLRFCRAYLEV